MCTKNKQTYILQFKGEYNLYILDTCGLEVLFYHRKARFKFLDLLFFHLVVGLCHPRMTTEI